MTIRGIIHKLIVGFTLQLVLCATSAFAIEPTLSAIRQTSLNYLSLPKGSHTTYGTSTTKSATYPYIVSIYDQDKQLRYFNPNETLPELNLALRYLARTGGGAWVSNLTSSDNYLFRFNSDYYGYDSDLLPTSAWAATPATSADYDFATRDKNGVTTYYNIDLVNDEKFTWTVSSVASETPPVWYDADTHVSGTVKLQVPHIVTDGSGNPTTNIEDVYYTYVYTVPAGYTKETDRTYNDIANSSNRVFAGLVGYDSATSQWVPGAAVYASDTSTTARLQSDFIGNYTEHTYGGGAVGLSNKTAVYYVIGDFVGNVAKNENGGGMNLGTDSTIKAIVGNFIGNYASDTGGAIFRKGNNIGTITGDFIANRAGNNGGAIAQRAAGKIEAITGDFVANRASRHGGAIAGGIAGATIIESIIGNFINNYAASCGGAIYLINSGSRYTVTGDFIGNYAKVGSGGAIYIDQATINLEAGDRDIIFYNNVAKNKYNDVYSSGGNLNLSASTGNAIVFNGTITGLDGVVNINANSDISGGQYVFNNMVSSQTVNIYNGANLYFGRTTQENGSTSSGSLKINALTNDDNGGLIDQMNTVIDKNEIGTVTLGANGIDYKIDVNGTSSIADSIVTTAYSTGIITLTEINYINPVDWANINEDYTIQVIKNGDTTSTLQLGLGETLSDTLAGFNSNSFSSSTVTESNVVELQADNNWNDKFGTTITDTITSTYTSKTVGLTSTSTANDSIGVRITSNDVITKEYRFEYDGDPLAMVAADTTYATKSFTTNDATKTYVLGANYEVAGIGAVKGELTVSGTIDGENRSTLDLNGKYGFELVDEGATLNLASMTIMNGRRTGNTYGGAVYQTSGTLNIENVVFASNVIGGNKTRGGAVYIGSDNNSITSSTFISNTATRGAAIYVSGTNSIISYNEFEGNGGTTGNIYGGTIAIENDSNTVSNNIFKNNHSIGTGNVLGGAIRSEGIGNIISSNTFTSNIIESTGENVQGGAIRISGSSNTIEGNILDYNQAKYGGAINTIGSYDLYKNNTFTSNTATDIGGAIALQTSAAFNTLISNEFRGNKA
ncbi:MAG: hypothetical protein J6T72_00095, partial [Alphaproteobacteria bacterium]|nr:hypothetical protein [Alphaproteobacteria bacterium]